MNPATSRKGDAEMRRAAGILKSELLPETAEKLISMLDPGTATLVNLRYESGMRGIGLDYTKANADWALCEGSSSLSLDHSLIKADDKHSQVVLRFPQVHTAQWSEDTSEPGWPHQPCVRISEKSEAVTYFHQPVKLEPKQFQIFVYYLECAQRKSGPVSDVQLRKEIDLRQGANLAPILSRIRLAFRSASKHCPSTNVRKGARKLLAEILPRKRQNLGYQIGRPELIIFV